MRIGLESAAGRQLKRRAGPRSIESDRLARLRIALVQPAAQIAVALLGPGVKAQLRARHKARQLRQRHFIDAALEFDHHIERHPVVVPAPGVELGVRGGAQIQIPVVAHELKKKPDLLLAFVMSARIAADEPVRHLIAQPVAGSGQHLDVLWVQSDLLVQLAEHGLLGVFAPINAALRKLP